MPRVIVLTGPTGVGKTAVLESLEAAPFEIVNCDSRQIYAKMEIGTDLPPASLQQRFPHHLYGWLDPSQKYSAGRFVKDAKNLIEKIHQRGKIPLLCGGTFFYVKALWDGIIEEPQIESEVLAKVEAMTNQEARARLQEVDPLGCQKIEANDVYRNKRALMVYLSAGRPISTFQRKGGLYTQFDFQSYYLDDHRDAIYQRINLRVQKMFEAGFLDEVQRLKQEGYNADSPGLRTIGYKEALKMERTHGEMEHWSEEIINNLIKEISQSTRRYAKRQLTWFRHEKRLKRIDHRHLFYQLSEEIST